MEKLVLILMSALVPIPAITRTNVRTVFLGTSVPHVLMGTEGMLRQASGWRMRRTPNKFVKRLMSVKRESAAVILMRNALTLMEVSFVVLVIRDSSVMDTRAVTLVTCAPMDHTRVMKMHGVPKLVQEDLSASVRTAMVVMEKNVKLIPIWMESRLSV